MLKQHGNRVVADFAGYRKFFARMPFNLTEDVHTVAAFVEWILTWWLIAKKDGIAYKEDVSWALSLRKFLAEFSIEQMRKIYDGSLFFELTGTRDKHS